MFHLHYDTDLDRLADRLAGLLAARDPAALLVPQTVLVPQAGLQKWLVQRLAERHGIAANLEFIAPAQMVWRALREWRPGLPYQSPFDREAMRWRLLPLLAEPPADEAGVAALVEGESEPLRRFQLAGHVAQLFERYQAYRRDLLDGWQAGGEADDAQAGLWRALTRASDQPSRSRLLGDYLHAFAADGAAAPPGLPARLFAFGCINVSPDVLRFLGLIGRHAEVQFFLPTPCGEYWGDIPHRRDKAAQLLAQGGGFFDQPANPLLVSMGGVGRDFVAQVFGYDEVQPDMESMPDGALPPRDSLLHRVQADVIEQLAGGADDRLEEPDPTDDSLTLHVCHSPMREVQVLHDRLLDLFQRHHDLEPRDVAVLVTDMGKYAPCVDAVFGAIERMDARYIPWTVADQPLANAHALTAMFRDLLDLPASRLGLDVVLDVLAVPAVARGCGLEDTDLDALRDAAEAAGICCDEDAADREARGLPAHAEFSWAFGRERVLLGYMLGDADDDGELVCERAPIGDIEGDRVVAFGQLLRIQRVLRDWRDAAHTPRTPAGWQVLLNRLLDALVPTLDGRGEEQALEAVRQTLAGLSESAESAGFDGRMDWRCLRDYLHDALSGAVTHQRFLAGGVSVCGMVPLRNVPFRVICVLGLDARSFPRQDPADAMSRLYGDLVSDHRRLGDRSMREDDRYLFLQTLMAARDVLHLSYVGIDARDASVIEPSVLVTELMEMIGKDYFVDATKARESLVVTHPLQPFSPRLFSGDEPRLFTYRDEWRQAAGTASQSAGPLPFADIQWPDDGDDERFDMGDLKRFFAAPQRWFLQRRVGLSIADIRARAADREPLQDDNLNRAVRERRLIERMRLGADDEADSLVWSRAHGWLPPLALGEAAHAASMDELVPQAGCWRMRGAGEVDRDTCSLSLPSGRVIEGHPAWRDTDGIAGWIGSGSQGKNWMYWWLEALVARAVDGSATGLALGRGDKNAPLPWAPKLPNPTGAKTLLDELLDIYKEGQAGPLPMPPRSAWAWTRGLLKGKVPDSARAMAAAMSTWDGEAQDPWIATALRGWSPAADEETFTMLAQRTYGPLSEAMQQGARP
ncbi:MAG TPA: exodeoxyribonuclease V subunit gamma [Oleiagrimonas sp.]|nr:exodeoxyribonuclease V subunit gamma [Oleiagrimonas sp.]